MAKQKTEVKPICPECKVSGIEHIVSEDSTEKSAGGDSWFNVAYCENCGHIYGVFAKVVNPPSITKMKLPGFGS